MMKHTHLVKLENRYVGNVFSIDDGYFYRPNTTKYGNYNHKKDGAIFKTFDELMIDVKGDDTVIFLKA